MKRILGPLSISVLVLWTIACGLAAAQTITEIIDATGDGAGKLLSEPTYIAVDESGNVFVAAQTSRNAFKITPNGIITEIIDATGDGAGNWLGRPRGIAVDSFGNAYVTGGWSDNVFKITPGGVITEIIDATGDGTGNKLDNATNISVDGADNLYVSGGNSDNVFKITPGGAITEIVDATGDGVANLLEHPSDIAFDDSGNVFVTGLSSDNVFKITSGGVITEIMDATGDGVGNQLDGPFDIAVDGVGNVFVSGVNTSNVFKITPGGVITEIMDATGDGADNPLAAPIDIAVDGAGNVFVAGGGSDNAFMVTPGGAITEIIDATGDGIDNPLNTAWGIVVDSSGNVYVTGVRTDNVFKISLGNPVPIEVDDGACNSRPVADNSLLRGSIWTSMAQSFTAPYSRLSFGFRLKGEVPTEAGTSIIYNLYEGEISPLTLLASRTVHFPNTVLGSADCRSGEDAGFVEADFSGVNLTAGQVYTVEVTVPHSDLPTTETSTGIGIWTSLDNPYPQGRFYFPVIPANPVSVNNQYFADQDMLFRIRGYSLAVLFAALQTNVIGEGAGKSLANKVALAQTYLDIPDLQLACGTLNGFLNQVRALRSKKLTPELADQLTLDAQVIMDEVGCG